MKARSAASPAMSVVWSTALLRRVQGFGQLALQAVIAGAVPEARPRDAGGAMLARHLALGVFAGDLVDEQILGDDHIAFQSHYLGDMGDAARAIAQAGGLDDHIHRADDHFADG